MFTWKRLTITLCVLVVALGAFTTLILPGIVKSKAEQWVAENTDRVLEIGKISINPVTLAVEISQLSLSEKDQAERFFSWQKLRVSLSLRSIYHLAPVLREIRLVKPFVHIERLDAATFNFSDLVPEPAEQAATETEDEPARFLLNNIVIENGQLDLVDHSLDGEISHTIRDLNLAIPFFGNLPYLVDEPVQPLFSAVINDSPVEMKGKLTPFADAREFSLNLALNDIDLPYYLAYLPVELPIELHNGRLGFDLQLLYRASMAQQPEFLISGEVNLTALNVWDRQGEQLFFLPLLRAVIAPSKPLEQDIQLASLDLYNLEVNVSRDRNGEWNHARLKMAEADAGTEETAPAEDAAETAFKLAVSQFRLRDAILFFRDDLPAGGFETTAREIMLDVKNFSLDPHAAIPITASLATDYDEQVSLHGHMGLTPFFVDIEIQANHLPLSVYQPYYQEQVAIKPGGQLDLQARVSISPEAPLEILDGRVDLHALDLPFTPKEGFRMNRMAITGLSYSLAENLLNLESLQLDRGDLRFSRNARGEWSFVSPDYPVFAGLAETDHAPAAAPAEEPADGTPFSYRVGEITVSDWSVDFLDRQPAKKARLQLSGIQSSVKNLAAPEKVASPFDLKATLNRTGQIHLSGDAIIASQEFNINSRLRNLPLNALAPYIAEQANLVLADGNLDARFNTRAAIKPAGLQVKFGGNIGVDKIYCLDAAHQEDLLKWDSLQIAGIKGSWAPLNLSVDSITMSDYFAKVLIDENAQLNFAQVFQKETSPQTGETDSNGAESPPPTKPAEVASGSEDAMNIRIDRVTLQGGQVDFTDRNLPRPFHVDMRELGGSIRGLSSDINTRANVDLRGKLRNQSPLVIEGALNPLAEEMFLDLKLNFSDIEMSPMSPYSGTYLGYLIENGKLHLALEYLVEEGKLQVSNEVFLDQFTFGDTVESEQATSLPVKLAIALLKDRNGEIHLDIPVSGVLDDPQFSIAGEVWTIIKNLLVKAATSPLALLGALVGGGDEDFSSIDFTYGSANLTEAERGKLANMAQALLDRPSLNLEVQGFVDPENDPEGYRREQLRMKIEHARQLDLIKQRKGQEDTAVAPLEIPSEEYSDYLWSVYKQAEFPNPRNFIGMVKHLPDAELEKLIYTNTVVGPDELAELAQARAQTARDYLVNEAGVAAEQVFLSAPDINKLPAKEEASRSRVEFGITVK